MKKNLERDPNSGKLIFARTKPHLTIEQQDMQIMGNNIDFSNNESIILLHCTDVLIMMKLIRHRKKGQRYYDKCITCEYETETGIIHMLIVQGIRFHEKYDYRCYSDDGVILVVSLWMGLRSKLETYYFNKTSRY